jgi:predicted O-methyltransferase YrrM
MARAIAALPPGPVVVEIGSFLGSGSILLGGALQVRGDGKLHCVDPFDASGDPYSVPVYQTLLAGKGEGKSLRECFDEHIGRCNLEAWVEAHQGTAEEVARTWAGSVDLLFLDGDQTPEGARRGFDAWFPYVKVGGIIAIHNSGPREYAENHNGSQLLALELIESEEVEYLEFIDMTTFLRKRRHRGSDQR